VKVTRRPADERNRPSISGIEAHLLDFITSVYNAIRWPGVVVLMAIESMAIPLPSEIIMPLAGWKLIKEKGLGIEWVLLAGFFGALGNTLGSIVAYYAGAWAGRPVILKYGKYILISHHDLDLADRFFDRWGNWAIFFSRLLPVVRTFISIPAGVSRMPIVQFVIYTFAGSFLWSVALATSGYLLGENYEKIRTWTRPADIPIVIAVLALVGWYIIRHIRRAWEVTAPSGPEV
jgi:membrane protein DedA with SNARE-associated domain